MVSAPSNEAFDAMMHAFRYAYSHRTDGITYRSSASIEPELYVDASNKPDPRDGKCLGGHVCIMGGAATLWQSRKLKHVGKGRASHTEYMALAGAVIDAVWVCSLLADLSTWSGTDVNTKPTTIHQTLVPSG